MLYLEELQTGFYFVIKDGFTFISIPSPMDPMMMPPSEYVIIHCMSCDGCKRYAPRAACIFVSYVYSCGRSDLIIATYY